MKGISGCNFVCYKTNSNVKINNENVMKLPYRIIVLLSFLQELGERVTQENINPLMFIYCHKYTNNISYHFVPVQGS